MANGKLGTIVGQPSSHMQPSLSSPFPVKPSPNIGNALNRITGPAMKSEGDNLITMIREAVQKVCGSKGIAHKNTSANATTFKGCYMDGVKSRYFCGVYFKTPYQHTLHKKYKTDVIHFQPEAPKGATSARSIRNTNNNTIFDMTRIQQPSPPFQLYSDNGYVHYIYKLDKTFFSLQEAQQQLDKVVAFVDEAYKSFESMRL
jgi:hypothetical protein